VFFGLSTFPDTAGAGLLNLVACKPCSRYHIVSIPVSLRRDGWLARGRRRANRKRVT
jgi:hypothetical protein